MAADHFAALGLSRRAALPPDEIRDAFQVRAKESHPDAGGDPATFEAINRAQATLANPAARLKHLAELEFGESPGSSGEVDTEMMGIFETVAAALAEADAFLRRRSNASTAIAKAILAKDEASAAGAAFAASGAVRARKAAVLKRLPDIDAALAGGQTQRARVSLDECSRALAFLGKWEAQLSERLAALAIA